MQASFLAAIRALIIDFDGTMARGSQPLPGLVDFFALLRQRQIAFIIATNNTTKLPEDYVQKLIGWGVDVAAGEVITASEATAAYLTRVCTPGAPLFIIGETGLRSALAQAGFAFVEDALHSVEAVVVGGDRMLTYARLKDAVLHLQRGARLIGANPDLLVPTEEGLVPEAGVTLAALQAATGLTPTIIGKPEPWLFDMALARMGANRSSTAVLGDRLQTDILGGQRSGLKTILVETGADARNSVGRRGRAGPERSRRVSSPSSPLPDAIFADLRELTFVWQHYL